MNKKIKIIIGIALLLIGLISIFIIPGGFTKDKIVEQVKIEQRNIAIVESQRFPTMLVPQQLQSVEQSAPTPIPEGIPETPPNPEGTPAPEAAPLLMASPEMAVPYATVKTVYQEILGIVKDFLSLAATIIGIVVAITTILKNKAEAAKAAAAALKEPAKT